MRLLLYVLTGAVVLVALAGAVAALIGARLPKAHVAAGSALLRQTPAEVYAVVRDFRAAPSWRTDLKRIEVFEEPDGRVRFREDGRHGIVTYGLIEDAPGQRMVTRILDTGLGYSGSWTYTLTPEGGGTRLTITENGEVSNVLFRFMSRYVFSQTATIEAYLSALAKRLA